MSFKSITQFDGGISANTKSGLANSFRFAKHLNILTDDDSLTLNPQPVKSSGATVTDLVKWMVTTVPFTPGDKWAYGDTGKLYRTDGGTTWSNERTVPDSTGQGLIAFENELYYAASQTLGQGGPLSLGFASMVYDDNFIHTLGLDIDNSQTLSGNTYTIPTTVIENSTNELPFTPNHIPINGINVIFGTRGTGDVTVFVHDVLNNVVATKTVNHANLPASGAFTFTFDTQWRPTLGQDYHFHAISTVADATLQTGTNADLSTVNYIMYFGILLDNDDFHPIIQHTNGTAGTIVIGNNDFMAVWDGITYNPNQIRIEPGYIIRGWTRENEFIVAYAWKGNDLDEAEDGKLFYWDGIQPYYNYSKPVTGGMPNALENFKNRIFGILGNTAILTLGTEPFNTIQTIPNLVRTKEIEVFPGAITTWGNRVHFGIGVGSTDDTGLIQGVYEYGNNSDRATSAGSVSSEVLNFGYTISTGDETGTAMKIGCCAAFGQTMYISWKSQAGTYGVDSVRITNDPASSGSYESLIDDSTSDAKGNVSSAPQKFKLAKNLTIAFTALPSGCTVTPKYKIDRAASWTLGTGVAVGIAGQTYCVLPINKRYREIEYGFDITATTNYPLVTGIFYEFDPLSGERQFN